MSNDFIAQEKKPSAPSLKDAALGPIRIEVGAKDSQPYKSIDHVVWEAVPPFAVLTGLNGSGKTQLLEVLAYRLTQTSHASLNHVNVNITGDSFGPDSVAYIPSRWEIGGAPVLGIAEMQQAKQQLYQRLRHLHNIQHDMVSKTMRARLEGLLGVPALDQIDEATFIKRLPDDFTFMLDEIDLTSGLSHIFLAHRLRTAEALEARAPQEEIKSKLGPAPWDVLNETFQAADFTYRVQSPLSTKLLERYELLLEDVSTGQHVRPTDLSSGEKTLMGLVVWLYKSQHHGRFPRLFLLDEPDAHLHPSMTRHLLNVIKDVLVERYHVRTILTTHSPSTVALAPDDAVFEMRRTQPRIVPSASKAATIGLLTAGLVTVSASTRYVLVEDEDDVSFYGAIRDLLTDYGPSRDPRALASAPTIVFLPASSGAGKSKTAGGKNIVTSWVEKFDQPPLKEVIRGAIDRDIGNVDTDRVYVLSRYSIENYFLDPFVVFGALLNAAAPPNVPGLTITSGDEHRLRAFSDAELQAILDAVRSAVEPLASQAASIDTAMKTVTFTNGRKVNYPAWMLEKRGHDLFPLYQTCFGGHAILNPTNLEKSLRRVRLIPTELADLMQKLQS